MLDKGEGKQATASGTTALWTVSKSGANGISAYVVGSVAIFVLANCSIAEFDVLYAAGKAIRIQPNMSFFFNGNTRANIKSICYRTATGTSDVDFAAF